MVMFVLIIVNSLGEAEVSVTPHKRVKRVQCWGGTGCLQTHYVLRRCTSTERETY